MQRIIDNEPLTGERQDNRLGSSESTIKNGQRETKPLDASKDVSQQDLSDFAYRTLENAHKNTSQPWLELSGHGQADGILRDKNWQNLKPEQVGQAISDANARYAANHPEDKNPPKIYGVINNGCLGNSVEFQNALGNAGVQRYVASANIIAGDSPGMLNALTSIDPKTGEPNWQAVTDAATRSDGTPRVAQTQNSDGTTKTSNEFYGSTVADVSDLSGGKSQAIQAATDQFRNTVNSALAKDPNQQTVLQDAINKSGLVEAGTVEGKDARPPDKQSRYPALAMYNAIANSQDSRIDPAVKTQAKVAAQAIQAAQLAHSYNPANEGLNDEGDTDRYAKGSTFVGPTTVAPWLANVEPAKDD